MSDLVDPETSLGFALKRLQQSLRARMDAAIADCGITSPQYAVLALLAEHPGSSNAELARRAYVKPPTMLRMLDALTGAGLVARAGASAELRIRGNSLTPRGRRRLAAASKRVRDLEQLLLDRAGPNADTVMAWLRSSAEALEQTRD